MNFRSDLIRHGAIVLAGTFAANLLGYAYHFAMSRQLGVSGYGSMLGLFAFITILSIPAVVAQTIIAKIIAGFAGEDRVDRVRRFVRFVVSRAIAVALAVATILYYTRFALAAFLRASDPTGIVLVAWAVLFYLIVPVLNGIMQGDQRFRRLQISIVSDAIIRAGVAILLVARGYGTNGALFAVAIGAAFAAALSTAFISDLLFIPLVTHTRSRSPFDVRASIRASAAILVISTLASIDVVLVRHYRTAYEAGLFGSLALIGRIVYLVASFVPTILLPKAASRIISGRSPIPLLSQAAAVFLTALGAAIIPLLAFPSFVLRMVVGNAYATAAPLLALYGSAIAFLAAAFAAANYNIGVNRLQFVAPVIVAGAVEVAIIAMKHDSLPTIVEILAGGHFIIFIATIYRIWVYAENQQA